MKSVLIGSICIVIMVMNGNSRSLSLLENVHATEKEDDRRQSGPVLVLGAVASKEFSSGIKLG